MSELPGPSSGFTLLATAMQHGQFPLKIILAVSLPLLDPLLVFSLVLI